MVLVFDLDGTLCLTNGVDYANATPIPERIAKVNELHDAGHTIIVETARGTGNGEEWHTATHRQLKEWGLRFDRLRTGVKFVGDVYVDDRGVNAEEFFGGPA